MKSFTLISTTVVITATLLILNVEPTSCEKILVLYFVGSKSHKNVYEPLYTELAKRGHQLTIVSPIKSGYTDKNIKEINGPTMEDLNNVKNTTDNLGAMPNVFDLRAMTVKIRTPLSPMIIPFLEATCKNYFEMPEVKSLLKQKFALVIVGSHMNECTYGFASKLNTSYIFVHPHVVEHYKSAFTGFRSPPSVVPYYASGVTDKMNFYERVLNFVSYNLINVLYDWIYVPRMEALYRSYLGSDVPSIREIEKNASLILNNAHFSLTYPRPTMPQVIDVAGMHCRPGHSLPKDLQDFLDSSGPDGFILFSMGSHVKASGMPEHLRLALVSAFSKIKQKVLWKWDTDKMEGVPSNVKLSTWVPQQDVLAHPKIKAFITHGGFLSTEESVYHGVPLIGLPLFGDQYDWNMQQAEANGYAITLEWNDLTDDKLVAAINKISADSSYQNRAKTLSKVFQDRPLKPLDTAVFWVEYVLKHRGAVHLRSPAADLNTLAYYSLDVILLVGGILSTILYICIAITKKCCCSGSSENKTKKAKSTSAKKRQ